MVNISSKSKFYSYPITLNFDIIVNSKDKVWNKAKITFVEISWKIMSRFTFEMPLFFL